MHRPVESAAKGSGFTRGLIGGMLGAMPDRPAKISSDHSRVLIAVPPARHIDAPKEISTSTPSSDEVGVPLLSVRTKDSNYSFQGSELLLPANAN
jgi:hypothetical protein